MTNTITHTEVCNKVQSTLREKLFHPYRTDLDPLISEFGRECSQGVDSTPTDSFVSNVNRWLQRLRISNVAFWNGAGRPLTAQFGLNAILSRFEDLWVFRHVLASGLADRVGIRSGEALLTVDDQPVAEAPTFRLGRSYKLGLLERDARTRRSVDITLPAAGPKNRPPMVEPTALTTKLVASGTGLLGVASFPGIIGYDFAQSVSHAISELTRQQADRLIIDLRGNCGGGLGSLRLMSYLTPQRIPVGYSLTRTARDTKKRPDELTTIGRIPGTKPALWSMALKFKFVDKDRSIKLVTEGLGHQRFHGRIAILVDEYTRSGAEMVAAFAQEQRLARIIGTKTPGETLGAANFRVGGEFRLRIPLVGWYTATDRVIEGVGVSPDTEVHPDLESLRAGRDPALEKAIAEVA
ncbi:MAG: S41 family peptidase [Bryobacteraceae bacterium]